MIAGGLRSLGVGPGDRVAAYLPEHPRGCRGVACLRLDRRDLVELLTRLRRPERDRPVRADRAACAARGGRLPVRRQGFRPHRCRAGASRGAADGRAHRRARVSRPGAPACEHPRIAHLGAAARARSGNLARLRAGSVRSPALGALQLRHDGASEGDRARSRRDHPRDVEEVAPPRRSAGRRPLLLVHDDGLDDVELPRRRAHDRRLDRALRRQSRPSGILACSGIWPRPLGSPASGRGLRSSGVARRPGCDRPTGGISRRLRSVGSTGSPLSPEGFAWVYDALGDDIWLFSTSGGTDLCTAFVGGVPTLPVHQGELQARALGARVESWSPEGRPLVGAGRRARDHEADALDADLLLGRPGREPLPRELLRDVPGSLAPRRLDRDHRPRHGRHLGPFRRDDQSWRRPHGHE